MDMTDWLHTATHIHLFCFLGDLSCVLLTLYLYVQNIDVFLCRISNSLFPGRSEDSIQNDASNLVYWLVFSDLTMAIPSDECNMTVFTLIQHWFRQWYGAIRQQAITWSNVDSDLWRHLALLDHSGLMYQHRYRMKCNYFVVLIFNEIDNKMHLCRNHFYRY